MRAARLLAGRRDSAGHVQMVKNRFRRGPVVPVCGCRASSRRAGCSARAACRSTRWRRCLAAPSTARCQGGGAGDQFARWFPGAVGTDRPAHPPAGRREELPVIAFVEDVAASGGYWLACAADEIIVDASSIVGSIGVMSAGFGFQDLIARQSVSSAAYILRVKQGDARPVPPRETRGRRTAEATAGRNP